MEAEANENEEEGFPPPKRIRTEAVVLDDEESEIASGLRPISRVGSQLDQDVDSAGADGEGEGEESDQGEGAVDDYSGDGRNGFEDNGVCFLSFHMISIWLISVLDIALRV
jgi:hypothetical protein